MLAYGPSHLELKKPTKTRLDGQFNAEAIIC